MDVQQLMEAAIDVARRGIAAGQTPFGCAIALDSKLIAATHNTVLATTDITAHAEVNALRAACSTTQRILLEGAVVATTCEPCPMCMAALHWARVDVVYYGATISDAGRAGFHELTLPAAELLARGRSSVRLVPGIMAAECRALFAEWQSRDDRRVY